MSRKKDSDLRRMIAKVQSTKKPSAKEARASTATVRTYDVTASDTPRLVAANKNKSALTKRLKAKITERKERDARHMKALTTAASTPIRREAPIPEPLPFLMAPTLPVRAPGAKPNIVALIYAFRAFQQYSHAFTRRNLGDKASREPYYQGLKKQFREAMAELGMDDMFDWSDF